MTTQTNTLPIVDETIELRTTVPENIITELRLKYPAKSSSNKGVVYKLGLNYLTLAKNFINSAETRNLIRQHGHGIISVYLYIRNCMCDEGYYVRVDGFYLDDLLDKISHEMMLPFDKTKTFYNALIENKIFFVIKDSEGILQGEYLTCIQQIYNYEMANAKRKKSRETSNKRNQKKSSSAKTTEQTQSSANTDEELPFN